MQTAAAQSYIPVSPNLPQKEQDGLNDRVTRYGIRFIRETTDLDPRAFMAHSIPANKFRQFVVHQFPVTTEQSDHHSVGDFVERMPSHQIRDLTAKGFLDLKAIAMLRDEGEAVKIFDHLTNPHSCSAYPFELGNACVTCWAEYLRSSEFQQRDFSNLTEAGMFALQETHKQLIEGMDAALTDARAVVNKAASDIDSTVSAKNDYDPFDYVCIRHLHAQMPTYKTANPNEALAKAIGMAMRGGVSGAEQEPALAEKLASLDRAIKEVEEMKKAMQDNREKTDVESGITVEPSFAMGEAVTADGQTGTVVGKPGGRVTVEFDGGLRKTFAKEELTSANA